MESTHPSFLLSLRSARSGRGTAGCPEQRRDEDEGDNDWDRCDETGLPGAWCGRTRQGGSPEAVVALGVSPVDDEPTTVFGGHGSL